MMRARVMRLERCIDETRMHIDRLIAKRSVADTKRYYCFALSHYSSIAIEMFNRHGHSPSTTLHTHTFSAP